jgi:hypothetical protein
LIHELSLNSFVLIFRESKNTNQSGSWKNHSNCWAFRTNQRSLNC